MEEKRYNAMIDEIFTAIRGHYGYDERANDLADLLMDLAYYAKNDIVKE